MQSMYYRRVDYGRTDNPTYLTPYWHRYESEAGQASFTIWTDADHNADVPVTARSVWHVLKASPNFYLRPKRSYQLDKAALSG